MQHVGVIGLGVIGKPIAERIAAAGHSLAVFDVSTEPLEALGGAGAAVCGSPAEVAARSDLVISLVLDGRQTDAVVHGEQGLLGSMRPGATLAVGSTLDPQTVRRIAQALAERGCDTLDMPISGGYVAAGAGRLSLMIGAKPEVLDRAMPVLRSFANAIVRAGDVGAGQAAKLAHQLVMTVNVMALLEGLALGSAAGVEPRVLRQILGNGLAGSAVLAAWSELGARWKGMLEATPPDRTPPNLRKDLHGALELARQLGVPLYLGTQASLIADAGIATGHDNPAF